MSKVSWVRWECSLAASSQTTTHMHGHHEATMGLAVACGASLGRELRALGAKHRFGAAWHCLRTRSQIRVQTAPSHAKWLASSRPSALA